jgi:hypothetical protein
MLSVDRYLEYPSVKPDTLEILENRQNDEHPGGYRNLKVSDPNELIYFYARSYWMTRYIEETRPGLLKSLFDKRYRHKELESRLAAAYHLDYGEFWKTANQEAVKRFNRREPVAVD